jgi:hypothetical protein
VRKPVSVHNPFPAFLYAERKTPNAERRVRYALSLKRERCYKFLEEQANKTDAVLDN